MSHSAKILALVAAYCASGPILDFQGDLRLINSAIVHQTVKRNSVKKDKHKDRSAVKNSLFSHKTFSLILKSMSDVSIHTTLETLILNVPRHVKGPTFTKSSV